VYFCRLLLFLLGHSAPHLQEVGVSKYNLQTYEIQDLPYLLSEVLPIRFDKDRKSFRPEYDLGLPPDLKYKLGKEKKV
jgi:hypothetical protein